MLTYDGTRSILHNSFMAKYTDFLLFGQPDFFFFFEKSLNLLWLVSFLYCTQLFIVASTNVFVQYIHNERGYPR